MRQSFHGQLGDCEAAVVAMTVDVLAQIDRVVTALARNDADLADEIINRDDPIDDAYVDLEQRVLTLLATQAPVASDLRLVSAILHINIHLERLGDLAVNCAKFTRLAPDLRRDESVVTELVEMTRQAHRMVDSSIQAFAKRDLDLALSLPRMDELINRLNRHLFKLVAQFADDEDSVEWGARMILVSRQLERMGDHAVDIGEQVAFMVTGEFREFTDASAKDFDPN